MRVPATSDDHPGAGPDCCDWGWVHVHPGTPGVVRPCEHHLAETHAKWLGGAFVPQLFWVWLEAA